MLRVLDYHTDSKLCSNKFGAGALYKNAGLISGAKFCDPDKEREANVCNNYNRGSFSTTGQARLISAGRSGIIRMASACGAPRR
jgi:hypothetical protein